jgi:hypothetical protein
MNVALAIALFKRAQQSHMNAEQILIPCIIEYVEIDQQMHCLFVCLFVWGPVSGCTAACRLIVHTPCVFNVPTFTARRLHVTTTLEILAEKCETCWARNFR